MPLKLATYNIHRCIGRDRRHDPGRICAVLRELNADVIALQEVESIRDGGLDLLTRMAAACGHKAIPGPTVTNPSADFGNAVLTRLDIATARQIDLSVPGREARGALDIELRHGAQRLRVIATHLGLRPAERRMQIRRLLALLRGDNADLDVLMGDLNEWFLWGRPLRWLHAHFEPTPAPLTFPACCPVFSLDRIWLKPRTALVDLRRHASPLARTASDHLPLCATLRD